MNLTPFRDDTARVDIQCHLQMAMLKLFTIYQHRFIVENIELSPLHEELRYNSRQQLLKLGHWPRPLCRGEIMNSVTRCAKGNLMS